MQRGTKPWNIACCGYTGTKWSAEPRSPARDRERASEKQFGSTRRDAFMVSPALLLARGAVEESRKHRRGVIFALFFVRSFLLLSTSTIRVMQRKLELLAVSFLLSRTTEPLRITCCASPMLYCSVRRRRGSSVGNGRDTTQSERPEHLSSRPTKDGECIVKKCVCEESIGKRQKKVNH